MKEGRKEGRRGLCVTKLFAGLGIGVGFESDISSAPKTLKIPIS
jgi:hypothetical protein